MRNIITYALFGAFSFSICAFAGDISLPAPNKSNQTSLMQALEQRHSDREFSDKPIDEETLSTILWAAYGVNRENGKRTIPTAKGKLDLNIYVFTKAGIWMYDAGQNLLRGISDENHLSLFQKQSYMESVPVVLVYTGSHDDNAAMHAGSAYQNVGLYAVANGMANVVRGFFDRKAVARVLNLPSDQRVIISQAIGWKK